MHFAHKQVQEEENEGEKVNKNLKDSNLTLLGLVSIKDPCRPGVQEAVEACQYAGVNIKMITGNNVFTAEAIATECGILRPNQDISGAVVEGEEFRNYMPEERLEKVDKICVMARSSPFDKFLMVQRLKQKGHVVAVTLCDGTNDASALKEADIVLSMGIQETEVAKESPDIVILDDNFGSVVTVLEGKSIFGVNTNVNNTLIFNTFVLCQVFNEFNARKLEKKNVFKEIHRSKLFLAIIGITIVLQVVMVEFLKKFASTERLNWWQWVVCIGFAAVSWPIGWLVKWIPVPE
ncbi:putative calcium-transporting ATPase 13, plasma membrane-type [Camellia lanceoleosa]|uniref:Calcium-transporting ATPase 13, plasma membrane-type n=1 Tax=Camellia lanceoleosa TaxID=1840588 RepID=A0ACC0I6E2_9ERIC|nr:putative calcium-transporting ATPase 13, plasma membrane-type [Camellia lanceoleosa]